MTLLFSHPACLEHDTGGGHPESQARLRAVLETLDGPDFIKLDRRAAPRAERGHLVRVHDAGYVSRVYKSAPESGSIEFVSDTIMMPATLEAALRAAGSAVAAVDGILAGESDNAFCAIRPPGHHAGPKSTMGFCFFNNSAIAAAHARIAHGLSKIAIVDFDVHHGNGTQAIFRSDSDVFFASVHQALIFPKTGTSGETGVGNVLNTPLRRKAGRAEFLAAITEEIAPAIIAHAPELIVISAGFDSHLADPIGDMKLNEDDFAAATRALMEAADACCSGRIVSLLEGGYNPAALASSVAAHVRELMKR